MNNQTDPLQSITVALQPITQAMGINECILGWPDKSAFTVDGKLPIMAVWLVSEKGTNVVSREQIHAIVPSTDGLSATVYREQMREQYMLQFSLFCKTEADRSNIGWAFKQHFTTLANLLIPIGNLGNDANGNPVEDALFRKFHGQRDAPGEPGFYQRDMTFEVLARVLDAETAYMATSIQVTQNVGTADLAAGPTATQIESVSTVNGDTRTIKQ